MRRANGLCLRIYYTALRWRTAQVHGLKKFHEFSVNSLAPLSICGSDSQCSHSSSIHESTVCRVYIMHGHTEPITQSISSPRAKPTTTSPPWPATPLVTRGPRAFPAVYRLVGEPPARRERHARGESRHVGEYVTPKRCAPLSRLSRCFSTPPARADCPHRAPLPAAPECDRAAS